MSGSSANRPRKLIITLATTCFLAGLASWSAMGEMRQNDMNRQAFAALQYGSASELSGLLDHGADPNYVPHAQSGVLNGLLTGIAHGHVTMQETAPPMLGYTLNGLAREDPRYKLIMKSNAVQWRAMHVPASPNTCADPLAKMRTLLEHHADANRSYSNANSLFFAVGQNRTDAVQLLMQFGADPYSVTARGDTARKSANRLCYSSIIGLMTSSGLHR